MGTGASAQATASVLRASPEAVQAVCEALSEEDRKKVEEVLAAKPQGTYLAQFFDKAEERVRTLMSDQEKLLSMAMDAEAKQKVQDESKAWYETEAKPLLVKAFHQFNTNTIGGDLLDPQEAAVFFAHLVREETDMAKGLSAMSLQVGIRMSMGMLQGLTPEEREQIKPQIEHQMKVALEGAQVKLKEKHDHYKAEKAAHDVAAFQMLDVNGDGTLELSEFLAAFEPDTDTNQRLHVALGYTTKEEIEQQKLMEEQGADAYRKLHTAVAYRCEG